MLWRQYGWQIESVFQEMEKTLQGEIQELGYPKAALFSFCVALLSYNVMSTVKAALVPRMVRSRPRWFRGITWRMR